MGGRGGRSNALFWPPKALGKHSAYIYAIGKTIKKKLLDVVAHTLYASRDTKAAVQGQPDL